MTKIVGILLFLAVGFCIGFFIWWVISELGFDTTPGAQIKNACLHYTDAYREGKPCITFDFFLSLYKVNPGRWYLRDFGNSIGYRTEEWQTFGTDVYWKTNKDRRKYFRWLKGELKQKAQEESNKVIKTISEQGLKDIEKLKKEIKNVTMNELMRIEAERDRYNDFYIKLYEDQFEIRKEGQ